VVIKCVVGGIFTKVGWDGWISGDEGGG
jgi:hypothetical protein